MLLDRGLAVLLFLLVLAVLYPVVPWLVPLIVGIAYGLFRKRHRSLANTLVLLSAAVVLSHQLHRFSENRLTGSPVWSGRRQWKTGMCPWTCCWLLSGSIAEKG